MNKGLFERNEAVYIRTKVALLGSSGIVAQRFQQRLANHPWFELAAVFGSPIQVGKQLSEIPWGLPESRPEVPELEVFSCELSQLKFQLTKLNIKLVFSALPSDAAMEIEPFLRELGMQVFSNSSAHRMERDVPLIIADLNPEHLSILKSPLHDQTSGFIACSTNCTVMPVALPLKPLWDVLGFNRVEISTEQSLSGGGYKLLKSANGFVSEIPGEAEKISEECIRLLGNIESDGIEPADFNTQVECKRVMRDYGHIVKVKIDLQKDTEINEIIELMSNHTSSPQTLNLPSAPKKPIILSDSPIDLEKARWAGADSDDNNPATNLKSGMAITVYDLKLVGSTLSFSAFCENTIRGAAGGCILLAELAIEKLELIFA